MWDSVTSATLVSFPMCDMANVRSRKRHLKLFVFNIADCILSNASSLQVLMPFMVDIDRKAFQTSLTPKQVKAAEKGHFYHPFSLRVSDFVIVMPGGTCIKVGDFLNREKTPRIAGHEVKLAESDASKGAASWWTISSKPPVQLLVPEVEAQGLKAEKLGWLLVDGQRGRPGKQCGIVWSLQEDPESKEYWPVGLALCVTKFSLRVKDTEPQTVLVPPHARKSKTKQERGVCECLQDWRQGFCRANSA